MARTSGFEALKTRAADAAQMLKLVGNEKRLLILCQLLDEGEASVARLADASGLGQSALSQHLAKLREEKLVTTRRDAQTIYYRMADSRAVRVLKALKEIYCP